MKLRIKLILWFTVIITHKGIGQVYDPLSLTKRIFEKDTLTDIRKFSIDEYQGHPNGADVKSGLKINCTLLEQNNKTAVVNITLTDSASREYDMYFHFKKDSVWKVCAFRALAMSGIIVKVHDDIAILNSKQIDSVISAKPVKGRDTRMFKSKEEYQYLLGNTSLTISSDKELIAHFHNNEKAFEELKNSLISKGIFKFNSGLREMRNAELYKKQQRLLLIDNVSPDSESNTKNLNFLIGGILDNSVGYLYVPNEKNLPVMSPHHFIMIRKLGNGWYLYKTT